MGISVDMFVKTYKANSKAKDKTFEDFIQKHITKKYIPFFEKASCCDGIIAATCYKKDGERKLVSFNSCFRYLIFIMKLIEYYTDIEINDQDIAGDYDKLNEIGAINTIINSIPEVEYTEFSTILNMKIDDMRDNEYSTTALLYNLKETLSISEEIFASVIEELQKMKDE